MIEQAYAEKQYSDELFEDRVGSFFNEDHYTTIYKNEVDVYYKDSEGNDKILVKLRKNVIPEDMSNLMISIFEKHAKKGSSQRAMASGGKRIYLDNNNSLSDTKVQSGIVGYFDRPKMKDRKYFNTNTVCRTTAFTRDNFSNWKKSLPFFKVVSNYYKALAPNEYKLQTYEVKKSPFQIGTTPFTTVTVNRNWRTACHKDKGDFKNGMGNLVVIGRNFEGGYLGFPQFKIAVDVKPGDLVIMNVHEWHCNTELKLKETSLRLSFVCYMRENMVKCTLKKIINGETMYYKS